MSPILTPQSVRFLALGDSYTIGEAVTEPERWPIQLAALLKPRGFLAQVEIIARTGWTTGELWAGIQKNKIIPPYQLVSLLIGVNNQYRGYSIDEYRSEFSFLLNEAIQYAGRQPRRVLVLSIPDWGVTPFAATNSHSPEQVAGEIDRFNAVNRDEAQRAGIRYVDVTQTSRLASSDLSMIASDGLHPSGKMYAAWASLALPETLLALGTK